MLPKQEEFAHLGLDARAGIALFSISLVFLFSTLTWSQEHDMASMPGMNMSSPVASEGPAQAAKHLADKKESEFNHRLDITEFQILRNPTPHVITAYMSQLPSGQVFTVARQSLNDLANHLMDHYPKQSGIGRDTMLFNEPAGQTSA